MIPDSASRNALQLTLNPRRVTRVLGLTAFVLVVISVAGQVFRFTTGHDYAEGLIPLFYLDSEMNIPSYFSAAQLLIAAMLLGTIAFLKRRLNAPHQARWTLLAFTFLYLSIDEAEGLHEMMTGPTRQLLGPYATGIFYYAWVVPGALIATALGLAYLKLLGEFPARIRRMVIIAATLFTGGAIGIELIGGWYFDRYGDTFTYSMIATVEESAEISGIIVFIHALLGYLGETIGELRVTFGKN